MPIAGKVYWNGDDGYEQARRDAVWNELKPDRHPAAIILAANERDVVEAVKLARERGLKVKARSGGHSWTGSSVRDDSILVNLSALSDVEVDPVTSTAIVGPGAQGRDLNRLLEPHGLFFPTGHCPTVGLGGFLLQGGWGWHSPNIGPACLSVVGVDVVTANGELVHADETTNQDLLWAARGAGVEGWPESDPDLVVVGAPPDRPDVGLLSPRSCGRGFGRPVDHARWIRG